MMPQIHRILATGLAGLRGLAFGLLMLVPTATWADDAALMEEAESALTAFIAAAASADREQLAALLAPEYQIMRSNGVGYERQSYLDVGAPSVKVLSPSRADDLVVTRAGDIMVVRYFLDVDETIDGQRVKRRAPRLTVFRLEGETWLVVAHGNFGVSG